MNASDVQFVKDQLNKPGAQSKKWKMTLVGISVVGFVYLVSMVLLFFRAGVAGQVASIGQVVVLAVSGMVAAFVGAQGVVDAKSISTLTEGPSQASSTP